MSFQIAAASGDLGTSLSQANENVTQYYASLPQHILANVNWAISAGLILIGIMCAILVARFFLSNAAE